MTVSDALNAIQQIDDLTTELYGIEEEHCLSNIDVARIKSLCTFALQYKRMLLNTSIDNGGCHEYRFINRP